MGLLFFTMSPCAEPQCSKPPGIRHSAPHPLTHTALGDPGPVAITSWLTDHGGPCPCAQSKTQPSSLSPNPSTLTTQAWCSIFTAGPGGQRVTGDLGHMFFTLLFTSVSFSDPTWSCVVHHLSTPILT